MANPTIRLDRVPVWGTWLRIDDTPDPGTIEFVVGKRLTATDGSVIYAGGAKLSATVGDQTKQDSAIRSIVRAAQKVKDQLAVEALGDVFDGTAWDSWWDTVVVPASIFTSFPANDDPNITPRDWSVTVKESLTSGAGKSYVITPSLAHLDLPVPGINLGTIEVPPGSPTVPAPMYAKGIPGGVASLDTAGKVPAEQIPDGVGGASTVDELTDATTVGKAVVKAATQATARTAIDAASGAQGAKADSAVQPAGLTKAAVGLGNVDNTADANKPVSTAQAAALAAKADLVGGKVPASQIPDIAVSDYLGAVATQVAMLALAGQKGDWATRTDLGTTWLITGADPTQLASWTALSYPAAPVLSVNGQTGSPTLEGITTAATAKVTPVDADVMPVVDSAASNVWKKVTWANIKATLKTYLDTLYIAKSLAGIDSLITALASGAGLDMPIPYATAYALGTRPAAPTGWKFRIYGGTTSDPDPTWMVAGDWRHIPVTP